MTFRLRPIAVATALFALPLSSAFAQSGQTPSPAMQAAMQTVQTQCAADMKTYCDGKTGPDRRACMQENADKLSDGCKSAIQSMMAARQAAPQ